jgi:hypothetical protein
MTGSTDDSQPKESSEERPLSPWEKARAERLKGRQEMFAKIRSVLEGKTSDTESGEVVADEEKE